MNINVTKIALYVVLLGLILFCGKRFLDRYNVLMSTEVNSDPYAIAEFQKPLSVSSVPETNVVDTADSGPGGEGGDGELIGEESQSEQAVENPKKAADTIPVVPVELMTKKSLDRGSAPDVSGIGLYVVALCGLILGFGVLAAHDISALVGQKTHKLLHNEEGEGVHSVAYDAAEELWANGEYLEAVRMMREYLNKNPREVHVMIRIAEIYEKDLGNYLAAALEYEELLKKKLPKERWAWSAIHLVNLYFGKIDKPKQGIELLYRIHREYGHTAAADKARKRLLQLDPGFQSELDHWEAEQSGGRSDQRGEEYLDDESSVSTPIAENDSTSHLPKGFRSKK